MFLVFHLSEHIWTLFTIFKLQMLSQIDSAAWWPPRNPQPGEANLTQVTPQMSLQESSKGGSLLPVYGSKTQPD